jgi:DNA-binding NarL/FixJ family response regulator
MAAPPCIDDKQAESLVRVLVVEDFEPFRKFIRSKLKEEPNLKIIGEVSDGLDAVREAEKLKPDLIFLDVGLPSLNGIQAARQIGKLSPDSKTIFVSQESSRDVVQEALTIAAGSYVVKTRAGTDLSPAVEAALHGRQFVTKGLLGNDLTEAAEVHAQNHLCRTSIGRLSEVRQ